MPNVKAGGAYVTLSITDEMKAGLDSAQAKIAAFADYAKQKSQGMFSFENVGKMLLGGAILGALTQMAMKNEDVAKTADSAYQSIQAMVSTLASENLTEIKFLFESLVWILGKLSSGIRAIIALVKDLLQVIAGNSFAFENFNEVLDNLNPEPMAAVNKESDKLTKNINAATSATRELTQAQKEYDDAWQKARDAGQSSIQQLQREIQVLKSGEGAVRGDEIYKEVLDAQYKLMEAQAVMERQGNDIAEIDRVSVESAKKKAEQEKEKYLMLLAQKQEIEAQNEQQKAFAEKQKQALKDAEDTQKKRDEWRKKAGDISGVSGTFALAAGGHSAQGYTQKDILKEQREQKEIQKKQLKELEKANQRPGVAFG